jgi:RNA polymerase sigma-70 factor, ECF subfamily
LNPDRFERLVNQHKDAVYRQMMRVCAHQQDAEDALATALLLAFQAADTLNSDQAFRSWLGTIGKRVCTRLRAHSGIQRVWEFAEEHDLIDPNVDAFEMEVLKGCVQQAVEELPELYRGPYVACEIEEKTIEEAAREFDRSEAAIKSQLHRARKMVRERLDRSVCAV